MTNAVLAEASGEAQADGLTIKQRLSPHDRAKLAAQLMRHEGTKRDRQGMHVAYRCSAGALTVGYGHNLDANPVPGLNEDSVLNEDQACRLLAADIRLQEDLITRALPFAGRLEAVRYAVLINMCFNLGINGLLKFKNTLALVERGDYSGAALGMLQSKWAKQVGRRARELALQMGTGVWA